MKAREVPGAVGALFMCRLYSIGTRTQPWGTPATIFLGIDNSPSSRTLNFLAVRKEAISLMRFVKNSDSYNLYSRPECHVVSISKNTEAIDILLLKFRVM
jgi:hypothetical protein